MFEVQEALEAQKQDYARKVGRARPGAAASRSDPLCSDCPPAQRPCPCAGPALWQEEMFRRREEALKKKDLELQESLLRFTRFLQAGWRPAGSCSARPHPPRPARHADLAVLCAAAITTLLKNFQSRSAAQENDAKRAKANRRAADEVRLREEKEREIATRSAERGALAAECADAQRALQRLIKWALLPRLAPGWKRRAYTLAGRCTAALCLTLGQAVLSSWWRAKTSQPHVLHPAHTILHPLTATLHSTAPPPAPRPRRYQQYLQSVVDSGDGFQEVDAILSRHATLEAANTDLRQQQAARTREAELLRWVAGGGRRQADGRATRTIERVGWALQRAAGAPRPLEAAMAPAPGQSPSGGQASLLRVQRAAGAAGRRRPSTSRRAPTRRWT